MATTVPDYMLNPDAVSKDLDAAWRYNMPPDYSKTRAFYQAGTFQGSSSDPSRS